MANLAVRHAIFLLVLLIIDFPNPVIKCNYYAKTCSRNSETKWFNQKNSKIKCCQLRLFYLTSTLQKQANLQKPTETRRNLQKPVETQKTRKNLQKPAESCRHPKNPQKSAENYRNLQKPAETRRNLQKPAETCRNLQKPAETCKTMKDPLHFWLSYTLELPTLDRQRMSLINSKEKYSMHTCFGLLCMI